MKAAGPSRTGGGAIRERELAAENARLIVRIAELEESAQRSVGEQVGEGDVGGTGLRERALDEATEELEEMREELRRARERLAEVEGELERERRGRERAEERLREAETRGR